MPQVLAEVIALRRKGVPEQLKEAIPGGFGLRAGLLADDASLPIERAAAQHLNAEIRGRLDADGAQGVAQLRVGDNAGAPARQLDLGAFENINVPAVATEQEGREQAAHRAADH
jgi:hypothetical protein